MGEGWYRDGLGYGMEWNVVAKVVVVCCGLISFTPPEAGAMSLPNNVGHFKQKVAAEHPTIPDAVSQNIAVRCNGTYRRPLFAARVIKCMMPEVDLT